MVFHDCYENCKENPKLTHFSIQQTDLKCYKKVLLMFFDRNDISGRKDGKIKKKKATH